MTEHGEYPLVGMVNTVIEQIYNDIPTPRSCIFTRDSDWLIRKVIDSICKNFNDAYEVFDYLNSALTENLAREIKHKNELWNLLSPNHTFYEEIRRKFVIGRPVSASDMIKALTSDEIFDLLSKYATSNEEFVTFYKTLIYHRDVAQLANIEALRQAELSIMEWQEWLKNGAQDDTSTEIDAELSDATTQTDPVCPPLVASNLSQRPGGSPDMAGIYGNPQECRPSTVMSSSAGQTPMSNLHYSGSFTIPSPLFQVAT